MKKQKENSHEGITWSEMGKQNVQAEKVYWTYYLRFKKVFTFPLLKETIHWRYRVFVINISPVLIKIDLIHAIMTLSWFDLILRCIQAKKKKHNDF